MPRTASTRVLVPAGALGLGWERDALARGVAARPDLIAIDGGSTDSGPSYLGRGASKYARARILTDWGELLEARAEAGCPLVLGTAGTCGAGPAVDWMLDITRDALAARGLRARIAVLRCDRDPAALAAGWDRAMPLPGAPEVGPETVAACAHVVALAGAEQVRAALETGAEVVICGRTTDTAILSALPLLQGRHAGAAWHGAKVAECGSLCSSRPWSGPVVLDVDATGFEIEAMAGEATPRSVAAHMLYENADPLRLHEPGGHLDVSGARYVQVGARVRAEGAIWRPGPYAVKLEGARPTGHLATSLALVRDPATRRDLDAWCESLLVEARRRTDAELMLLRVGHDATLGPGEPAPGGGPEVGILLKARAATPEAAMDAVRACNPLLLHHSVGDGPMPTFAFPLSPPEQAAGEAFEFVLHHLWPQDDPMDGFALEVVDG